MNISIPDEALETAHLTPNELLIEFAAYLYDKDILSIGQAKKIAGLDLISFQKELAKRNIVIHYNIDDLNTDLTNLKSL